MARSIFDTYLTYSRFPRLRTAKERTIRSSERAEGTITDASKKLEKALRRDEPDAHRNEPPGFVREVPVPDGLAGFKRVVEKITGVKIVFVAGARGRTLGARGFYAGGRTLYVLADDPNNVRFVTGHEFTHFGRTCETWATRDSSRLIG